ncbi:isoprenylcysteine carboxyl methyltransferase family protein [Streptomyces goshikiensis]|uniref:isoprenylcysteine carboxyl methyltransferase family protein n=1 Tax=Streptomyces goshikiensis TaxID=1942 RepID=UPI0037D131C3
MTLPLSLYLLLLGLVAAERIAELAVARRNARWSLARGAREYGRGHYPAMVALHTALLVGCAVEPWAAGRPFVPMLGWSALALAALAQGLRWWCITTLGPRWNTRVLVVPGLPLVAGGPYRLLRHPNYVAVVVEGAALPLVHSAWLTAAAFTALNAALLTVRIRCEDTALTTAPAPAPTTHAATAEPTGTTAGAGAGAAATSPAGPSA